MLEYIFLNNRLEDWIIALSIILGTILLNRCIILFDRRVLRKIVDRTSGKLDNIILESVEQPFVLGTMLIAIWVALSHLNINDGARAWIEKIYHVLTIINITWVFSKFFSALIKEYAAKSLNGKLMPLLKKGVVILIWVIGIVTALNNIGVQVTALLGALGVGGMAIALAAQDTVKNMFGGVTILTDRPFRIGDTIQFDNFEGEVVEIGLRSTRIKTYDRRIVTVPNFKLMDASVINISSEPNRRIVIMLGLTYDTTPDKMREAVDILQNLPKRIVEMESEVMPSFCTFGDFSLNIRFAYYIKKGNDIYITQSKVNFEILDRFNQVGLNFAYPTQTLFMGDKIINTENDKNSFR